MTDTQDSAVTIRVIPIDDDCKQHGEPFEVKLPGSSQIYDIKEEAAKLENSSFELKYIGDSSLFKLNNVDRTETETEPYTSEHAQILKRQLHSQTSDHDDVDDAFIKLESEDDVGDHFGVEKDDDSNNWVFLMYPEYRELSLLVQVKNKDTPYLVKIRKDRDFNDVIELLKKEDDSLGDVLKLYCLVCRLVPPMPAASRASLSSWKHKTLDRFASIKTVFTEIPPPDHISIVIDTNENSPDVKQRKLFRKYPDLIEALEVNVERIGKWTENDLTENKTEFVAKVPERALPEDAFKTVIESLSKPRQYEPGLEKGPAFIYLNRKLASDDDTYFIPASTQELGAQKVSSEAEFEYFARASQFQTDPGSSLPEVRRITATTTFFFPPFMNLAHLGLAHFTMDEKWTFPILLENKYRGSVRYTPKSEVMLALSLPNCKLTVPFVICKYACGTESDFSYYRRLLLQGMAAVHVGNHLLKDGHRGEFFTIAIYISHKATAHRFIIYQPNKNDPKVSISQRNFELGNGANGRRLLLELYNTESYLRSFRDNIDEARVKELVKLTEAADIVEAREYSERLKSEMLSEARYGDNKPSESSDESSTEIELSDPFEDDEVIEATAEWGIRDIFIRVDCPHVAIVMIDDRQCYLKYVSSKHHEEVKIYGFLSNFKREKVSRNHTPSLMKKCSVSGGYVMLLEGGGDSLDIHLKSFSYKINSRKMLDIALQYFEGVAFLHEKSIQHNDLKMKNVTMDDSGRVFVIDYGLATQKLSEVVGLGSVDTTLDGEFMGTKDWTAPEVGSGKPYSAKMADIWAAGNVMFKFCEELIGKEGAEFIGGDVDFLKGLCLRILEKLPDKRLRLTTAIKEIEDYLAANPSDVLDG